MKYLQPVIWKHFPLLGMFIDIDIAQLNDLISQMDGQTKFESLSDTEFELAIGPSPMDSDMKDAAIKLIKALRTEQESRILAPGLVKGIYYRALCGKQAPVQGGAESFTARKRP